MKTDMKVTALIFVTILMTPIKALAGNEGAAGGDGVILDGAVKLLDFVESGIENEPYINNGLRETPGFTKVRPRVEAALARLRDDEVVDGVTLKLLEISRYATPVAYSLLNILESYTWSIVTPELLPINDEDSPLFLQETVEVVQLAARQFGQVYINRQQWEALQPIHRVGLIFHEIVYAGTQPTAIETRGHNGERQIFYKQISSKARQLVGFLFAQENAEPGPIGSKPIFDDHIRETFGIDGLLFSATHYVVEGAWNTSRVVSFEGKYSLDFQPWRPWYALGFAAEVYNASMLCSIPPWHNSPNNEHLILRSLGRRFEIHRSSLPGADGQIVSFMQISYDRPSAVIGASYRVDSYEHCIREYGAFIDQNNSMWKSQGSIFE